MLFAVGEMEAAYMQMGHLYAAQYSRASLAELQVYVVQYPWRAAALHRHRGSVAR